MTRIPFRYITGYNGTRTFGKKITDWCRETFGPADISSWSTYRSRGAKIYNAPEGIAFYDKALVTHFLLVYTLEYSISSSYPF